MSKVIEELKRLKDKAELNGGTQFNVGYVKAINTAINLIGSTDNWISVDDALPEKFIECNVYNGIDAKIAYFDDGGFFCPYEQMPFNFNVTHWQPIKPPNTKTK